MKLKQKTLVDVASIMADRFSAIVAATGELTEEQMREAIYKARADGVQVPFIRSSRSLAIINEAYCER